MSEFMNGTRSEPGFSGPGQRVLVIDDDAVIGLGCKRVLSAEGWDVESYEDPEAGLQAALSGDFDVILVDLVMPSLEGLEVLRRIKARAMASEIVIITAHSTVESAVAASDRDAPTR